jgi:glycerol-3-phosphate acyltransferase PlsY
MLIMAATKKASVASIVAVPVVVAGFIVSGTPGWELWSIVGLGILVEIRHLSNIKRLLRRSEPTITGTNT